MEKSAHGQVFKKEDIEYVLSLAILSFIAV